MTPSVPIVCPDIREAERFSLVLLSTFLHLEQSSFSIYQATLDLLVHIPEFTNKTWLIYSLYTPNTEHRPRCGVGGAISESILNDKKAGEFE